MSDEAEQKAEAILRSYFTPFYPIDKPFSEMTTTERALIKPLIPHIAAALREAQDDANTYKRYWEHTAQESQERGAEIAKLKSLSAVEMMCENLNVKHHISEWETRCLKAEAERDELRTKLVEECAAWKSLCTETCADYDAEVAKLKAGLDEATSMFLRAYRDIAVLEAERDAAYVRGLERAMKIMQTEPHFPLQGIRTEIDKAKGEVKR